MPSSSALFFWRVLLLVASCAESVRQVAFFCRSALHAGLKFSGPLSKFVQSTMLYWRDNNKVFKSVVLRVPVYMVNVSALFGAGYKPMLIFPHVRLRNFYAYIHKSVLRFVEFFGSNRQGYANFVKYIFSGNLGAFSKRFSCAVNTSWRVVVGVAVFAFSTYDGRTAKRAKFEWQFFGHDALYAKQNRFANAF